MPSAVSGLEHLGAYFDALPGRAPSPDPAPAQPLIRMRYRRGDGWQQGRVRNLTTTSIGVACGCPPSKDDIIAIELRARDLEVVVDAVVLAVTPPETAEVIGAYGFGARFFDVDAFVHHRLRQMVAMAAAEEEPVAQPPRRRHPRFPVRWPVQLASAGATVRAFAVDLSARGMFVASEQLLALGAHVSVLIPEEVGERPLHLRARVMRALTPADAFAHRGTAGIGLEIVSMDRRTATRYAALVDRVSRRARKAVLVVANRERLTRMSAALRAVGYPVSGTDDPTAVVKGRALRAGRAALVILDASSDPQNRGWIEAARCELRGRGIPSLVVRADAAHTVWRLADATLLG